MERREFLRLAALASATWGFSALPVWARSTALELAGWRSLVLVELAGGNDGLNTLVPFRDPAYRRLRPGLALSKDQVLPLADHLGLHPALESLMGLWREGRLAWVQGVGYENPNRSHFRSIEIWETASQPEEYLHQGWLAPVVSGLGNREQAMADGVVLGAQDLGPLLGQALHPVVVRNPEQFLAQARRMKGRPEDQAKADNSALSHLLQVQEDVQTAADRLQEAAAQQREVGADYPRDPFSRQLEAVAKMIAGGAFSPVWKVTLGGFDTHANQEGTHRRLLGQLAGGLSAFTRSLKHLGLWRDTLIMSYSEFGRRAAENGSRGTDHGTAAPHFFLGGRVRGGLRGKAPSLTTLADGDLEHTVDFRRLYATVATQWWGTPSPWPVAPLPVLSA